MNNRKKLLCVRGFTLIEILVVIAIIGILSSVVLISLSTARSKGKDAAVQEQMGSLRGAVELASNGGSYTGTFTGDNTWASSNANISAILAGISAQTSTTTAGDSANSWAAEAQLPSSFGTTSSYFCVDSSGKASTTPVAIAAGATSCP